MRLSDKAVAEFKEIYRKEFHKEISDGEARESAERLMSLAKLLYDCAFHDARRRERLKTEPKGFPVEGTYNCLICHTIITAANGWYDRWGQKCQTCQRAVDSGAVPGFVCRERNSWYATWQLKQFGVKSTATAKKLVREEKLKTRTVLNNNGTVYQYLFLKKENPRPSGRCQNCV